MTNAVTGPSYVYSTFNKQATVLKERVTGNDKKYLF
jgi:hypothetical protein